MKCSKEKFEKILDDSDPFDTESIYKAILHYCNAPDGCCDSNCVSTGKCFSVLGFVIGTPCFFFFFMFCLNV
jgi:hypothetical protein